MKNDILIYGSISREEYGSAWLNYMVSQIPDDSVRIRFNSPGGSVVEADAMYAILKNSGKAVSVHIDGVCASAAMQLYMKFDNRFAFPDVSAMIHNVGSSAQGDYKQLANASEYIKKLNDIYASRISSVFNVSVKEAEKMMEAETWFTGQELIDKGIAQLDPNESQIDKAAAKSSIESFADAFKDFKNPPGKFAEKPTKNTKDMAIKEALALKLGLEAEAKDTTFIEKVDSLHSRAELVPGLQKKVEELEAKAKAETTKNEALKQKLQSFEIESVKAEILKTAGVEMAEAHNEAFDRRVKRYLSSQDETVKADMKDDLATFAKLNGTPVGVDPTLSGANGDGRQDGVKDAEAKLDAKAQNIIKQAKSKGEKISYIDALNLAKESA